jgi:hypothetical protein
MNRPTEETPLLQTPRPAPSSLQRAKAFANHIMALLIVLFWAVVGTAGLTSTWVAVRLLWRFSGVLLRAGGVE